MATPLPAPRRLLVRGVNWLGDAVMTTPALLRLRAALPGTRILLVTAAKLADLWPAHPAVDEVVTFSPGEGLWSLGRRLRALDCDTALVLPNSPRSALECRLAGIPRRIGYARPWRNWLLTDRVPARPEATRMRKPSVEAIHEKLAAAERGAPPAPLPPSTAHHTHEYLHLVAALGASADPLPPQLVVRPDEIHRAREKFGLEAKATWLALNPGAEYGPAKRWPVERFAGVAAQVQEARAVRWLLLGGPNDRAATAAIQPRLKNAIDLAGRTTLRELMAVLAGVRLVLTNDTGPMHVAAALGIPVVVPFGSTSIELTGPGLPGEPRHRLLRAGVACAPCFLRECPIDFRCMGQLTVEHVTAAALEVLGPPRVP